MEDYRKLEKIGEGTFGIVYKAEDSVTGQIVAMKKIKLGASEGIPATALREMDLLQGLKHPNIICLIDIVMDQYRLYLIFEYLSMDLKKYMDSMTPDTHIDKELVRRYLYQITNAIHYCHRNHVLHRDLKPQNILIDKKGVIKVADFGLGRSISPRSRVYTHEVVTLWYRAPEILLGSPYYAFSVDIWSIGCIFAEMSSRKPLFQGDSEINQLFHIFRILKTPTEDIWPGVTSLPDYKATFPCWSSYTLREQLKNISELGIDLLQKMLIYDPFHRFTARDILNHPYFDDFTSTTSE
ncbi:cyclin-dependent kinase 1-like [Teleopsis dalmanni]|uniref:cyclin-dependent kinase 1-like n=1 Tax=Teleopsis dalmanni TaxID=139649 RepID=UPI0018CD9608|nr:cyclin-dependent kinase 1-like [Teleopsis dalmanni]